LPEPTWDLKALPQAPSLGKGRLGMKEERGKGVGKEGKGKGSCEVF